MHPILFRIPLPGGGSLPIYSYGMMLAVSFIVGWYLTLGLAHRDGLPKETMANCYVITALSAVVCSRLLYVLTNLDEFHAIGDVFALRSGGMVAYGGFVGGFLGSLVYLNSKRIPLIPWADVAVPSLASGLLITRIGCYLYGCDFGRPLSDTAPAWLRKLGSFPKWPENTVDQGAGSPAWVQHVKERGLALSADWSLPVHPTQLYESATGLGLLLFLLVARRYQAFRGQIFLYFTFFYGFARFLLEFLRDDAERGDVPPALEPHFLFPLCLAFFAIAFTLGIAQAIRSKGLRVVAQVGSFIPVVWSFLAFKPEAYATVGKVKLSTSQFIGVTTAVAAAAAFSMLYRAAMANPKAAMAPLKLDLPQDDESEEASEVPAKKKKGSEPPELKKPKKKKRPAPVETSESNDEASNVESATNADEPAAPGASEPTDDPAPTDEAKSTEDAALEEPAPAPKKKKKKKAKPASDESSSSSKPSEDDA
ncbi:MAG: prolipoprotein diacylglyceryl transferase family protein [Polyangiaceae bacterium]